jgi:hypothetical protein
MLWFLNFHLIGKLTGHDRFEFALDTPVYKCKKALMAVEVPSEL